MAIDSLGVVDVHVLLLAAQGRGVVHDVSHVDVLELVVQILAVLVIVLSAACRPGACLGGASVAVLASKAAKVLADGPFDLS